MTKPHEKGPYRAPDGRPVPRPEVVTEHSGPGRTTPAAAAVRAIRYALTEQPYASYPAVITTRRQWEALLRWIEKR